jgi:uncharacterized LabA/DUF88 family protein
LLDIGEFSVRFNRGGSYSGPREISYLFIDGGYLDKILDGFSEQFFAGQSLPVDPTKVSAGFTKTFYYNCLPVKRNDEDQETFSNRLERQEKRFELMQSARGWHVREGFVKRTRRRGVTQKEIDVLIAVDMLTHAYRRNMHTLSFIAGDQDFRPLVEALVRDGMFVELLSESKSVSQDLILTADAFKMIDLYLVYGWLDTDFRNTHSLPERSWNFPKSEYSGNLLEQCETNSGDKAKIYQQEDGKYLIVTQSSKSLIHMNEMTHVDLSLLKKVHAYCFGDGNWKHSA